MAASDKEDMYTSIGCGFLLICVAAAYAIVKYAMKNWS